jgi:hypothetical protein
VSTGVPKGEDAWATPGLQGPPSTVPGPQGPAGGSPIYMPGDDGEDAQPNNNDTFTTLPIPHCYCLGYCRVHARTPENVFGVALLTPVIGATGHLRCGNLGDCIALLASNLSWIA